MAHAKKKFALWISPEAKDLVEKNYRTNQCKTRSQFIEDAIIHYTAYINAKADGVYLPRAIGGVMEGALGGLAEQLGKLLFKLSVEESMLMHIIAHDTDISLEQLDRLRARCVHDVMSTHGQINFKDILRFQKEL